MRRLHFAALAAAGALLAATPAFAADSPVAGTWATEAKSDFGTFKSTWTVANTNGTYTVDVKDAPPEAEPVAAGVTALRRRRARARSPTSRSTATS